MAIKIENGVASINSLSYNSLGDTVGFALFYLIPIYVLIKFNYLFSSWLIWIFATVFFISASSLVLEYIFPAFFSRFADKYGNKIIVRLDKQKNIICRADYGYYKNTEFLIKRDYLPILRWEGFWRLQNLSIYAKNYHPDKNSEKAYLFAVSVSRIGFRYKKEEVKKLAEFLQVPIEGSLNK
jgi:hypothetical protein